MLPFFNIIRTDLEVLAGEINKELKLRTGSVMELVSLQLEYRDLYLRPALVLLAARAYGYTGKRAIGVASVVQFIYLATRVHDIVQDEQNSDTQFPVLVGDYLYGQFFRHLCIADALHYLAPLSEVICEIHEGGILRKQLAGGRLEGVNELDILEKEEAILCAAACKIGADLGGASREEQELFWQFGKKLGLGVAAAKQGLAQNVADKAFMQARMILASLSRPVPGFDELITNLENRNWAGDPSLPNLAVTVATENHPVSNTI